MPNLNQTPPRGVAVKLTRHDKRKNTETKKKAWGTFAPANIESNQVSKENPELLSRRPRTSPDGNRGLSDTPALDLSHVAKKVATLPAPPRSWIIHRRTGRSQESVN